MVNSILIPVITAYYIKGNLYEVSGLVDNIFMLSITTSILPPLLVLFDPYHIFMKIMRCIKSKPSTLCFMQQANYTRLKKNITYFIKGLSFKSDITISILQAYLCLSATLSLCNLLQHLLDYLAIFSCTGIKNTASSNDIKDLCLELTS